MFLEQQEVEKSEATRVGMFDNSICGVLHCKLRKRAEDGHR
jgi:hypothetical protein